MINVQKEELAWNDVKEVEVCGDINYDIFAKPTPFSSFEEIINKPPLNQLLAKYPEPERYIISGRINGTSVRELSLSELLFVIALNMVGAGSTLGQVAEAMSKMNGYEYSTCSTIKCELVKKGVLFIEDSKLFLAQGMYTANSIKSNRIGCCPSNYIYRRNKINTHDMVGGESVQPIDLPLECGEIIKHVEQYGDRGVSVGQSFEQLPVELPLSDYTLWVEYLVKQGFFESRVADGDEYIRLNKYPGNTSSLTM